MEIKFDRIYWGRMATNLRKSSKEICQLNDCKRDSHNCHEVYAYFNGKGELCDICSPDYAQRSYESYISFPFTGKGKELFEEFKRNLIEEK